DPGDVPAQQLLQPRLVHRDLAAPQRVDLLRHDVEPQHLEPELRHGRRVRRAEITGPDHGDLEGHGCSRGIRHSAGPSISGPPGGRERGAAGPLSSSSPIHHHGRSSKIGRYLTVVSASIAAFLERERPWPDRLTSTCTARPKSTTCSATPSAPWPRRRSRRTPPRWTRRHASRRRHSTRWSRTTCTPSTCPSSTAVPAPTRSPPSSSSRRSPAPAPPPPSSPPSTSWAPCRCCSPAPRTSRSGT